MRVGVLAAAVLPALIAWSAAFLGWRWACRRLGLRGPDPAGAGARERAARRSLRTLDHARRRRTGAPERARRSLWADGPHALLPRRRAATPPDGAGPGAPGPG